MHESLFRLYSGVALPKVVKQQSVGFAAELRKDVQELVKTMKVGQCFYVPDEKYARYASDYAKTINRDGEEVPASTPKAIRDIACRKVSFREIPRTGCEYGVWRVQ